MTAWLSLPNMLSLVRLPLAALSAWLVLAGGSQSVVHAPSAATSGIAATMAMLLFWLAVASDVSDGRIARARHQVTALGGLFDHGSDAAFVTALLAAWAWRGEVPPCLPVLVPLAFLQYVFDSRALAGQRLRASRVGRWNGVAYFVLAGIPTVRDGLGLGWPQAVMVHALGWLLIATTVLSMCDRAWTWLRLPRA